ncbi:VWA domain-containing protein [uncultured Jatrophihabitans sp.]|uniref:VWA domain-containing protein n=1 Tax=uncultured Jatrophihabitans sp. TaxID=1610747 RepID=UPI0035CA222A
MTLPLLEHQLAFVTALRDAGLTVSVAEGLDAAAAMRAVDLRDRGQLRDALAATLVKRQAQRPVFDAAFDVFYPAVVGASVAPASDTVVPARDDTAAPRGPLEDPVRDRVRLDLAEFLRTGDERLRDAVAREAVTAFGAVAGSDPGTSSWSRLATLSRVSAQTLMATVLAQVLAGGDRGGLVEQRARTTVQARITQFEARVDADVRRRLAELSDAQTVSRRTRRPTIEQVDFLGATRADLVALRREIQPLARRLATRLALDRRRGSRGQLDFRRTIRASLSTGGVPVETLHRPRRPLKHDLVVICDLSESVSSFAHFTLLLVFALHEVFGKVLAFGFVDELDELTRFFTPGGDVLEAVVRLTDEADVTAMFGRTDYGRAFELLDERFPDVVGTRTSLLVLGDARSNYGDLALPVLRQFTERARHAYWLNPERRGIWNTGDSRAAEVDAIIPMRECRNLTQLGEFVRDLTD